MERHIDTQCIQAGYEPMNGEARVVPITQSTTYKYDSGEHVGKLFDLEVPGFFYTRLANPTVDAVEKKITVLEGGVGTMCTSSGQSATMLAVLNIADAGDNIISSMAIYGGTLNLFAVTMKRMGIHVTFVDPAISQEELASKINDKTKAFFIETLANPTLVVADIEKFAGVAHEHHIPLMVDNTFATPIKCRPIEWGADIVIHSTSKYMDGHAISLGGAIVDSGRFDWTKGNFKGLTEPDESYHGIVYTDTFKEAAYITKARVQLMRDMGAMMAPQNAFLLNVGMETLHLRMERHCQNAFKAASFLEEHNKVSWVNYPDLKSSPYYDMARKYMPNGTCGVISFGVEGGREAATRVMDSMKLAAIVVHVADARTSVLHPASTTHRQLTDKQLEEAGIAPNMLRFSVGIEHADDILADLEQALNVI